MPPEHLRCSNCGDNVQVARFDGGVRLVCHCTHVDSDTDPAAVPDVSGVPTTWRWV